MMSFDKKLSATVMTESKKVRISCSKIYENHSFERSLPYLGECFSVFLTENLRADTIIIKITGIEKVQGKTTVPRHTSAPFNEYILIITAEVNPAEKPLKALRKRVAGKKTGADEHTRSIIRNLTFSPVPSFINAPADISVLKVCFTYALMSSNGVPSRRTAQIMPHTAEASHVIRVI